jgi:hypothetical protein
VDTEAFNLIVQQTRAVLAEVATDSAPAEIQLVGGAAIKLLAAIGKTAAGGHAGTRTCAQEQSAGDQHDFKEIRFHCSVASGCKHGHAPPEAIILSRSQLNNHETSKLDSIGSAMQATAHLRASL